VIQCQRLQARQDEGGASPFLCGFNTLGITGLGGARDNKVWVKMPKVWMGYEKSLVSNLGVIANYCQEALFLGELIAISKLGLRP
jgi:hypothetical protein